VFSRDDADNLRRSLGPMRFHGSTPRSSLIKAYCDFYGLHFASEARPVEHSLGLLRSGEFDVVCQHFQLQTSEQRGTVFLLHGYFDHVGIYNHLIQHCLDTGFSVVIFDLPGHGLSSGTPASIRAFDQYSAALFSCLEQAQTQEVNSPWVAIGQSTGGAILLQALLHEQLTARYQFESIILLAPLLRPRHWWRSYLLFLLTRPFITATPRTFAENSQDQAFLEFLQNSDALQSQFLQGDWVKAMIRYQSLFERSSQQRQALNLIQGSEDGTVNWQYNLRRITEKFPDSKIYMIEGAGHHLVNESERYRDRVFTAIDNILIAARI
jgi:alpha-beta hydrolase superfamily lysophospholipase